MKSILYNSFFIALMLAFTACGGGGEDQQDTTAETTENTSRTIDIIGTDQMKFTVVEAEEGLVTGGQSGEYIILEAIEASPGEEIQINMRTISNIPKTAMAHNFVLLELDADVEEFATTSAQSSDNDYISSEYEDNIIVATSLLGDGESDSVTFNVPDEPGEYYFVCTFPAHYGAGMVGRIIVE